MANILITGGTKGIGKAIARLFVQAGHNIIIVARSADDLVTTRKELLELNPEVEVLAKNIDLRRKREILACAKWLSEKWETLDVLVNNAALFVQKGFVEEPANTLEKTLATNLLAPYYLTKSLLPLLQRSPKAHIFNICSVASRQPFPEAMAYGISKYALLGFSQNLRESLKTDGIRVTAVLPGATYTSSWAGEEIDPKALMPPEDVAQAIFSAYEMSERTVVEELILRPRG